MKKILAIILCLSLLTPSGLCSAQEQSTPGNAQTVGAQLDVIKLDDVRTSGIYEYCVLDEEYKWASIQAIHTTEKKVVIPSEIDGYQVCALGYGPYFFDYYKSERVSGRFVVPDPDHPGVNKILYPPDPDQIWIGMSGEAKDTLEEIVIPSSVKVILSCAFDGFSKLSKVSFPDNIYLQRKSMLLCGNLKQIDLPDGVTCQERSLPTNVDTVQVQSNKGIWGAFCAGNMKKLILNPRKQKKFNVGQMINDMKVKQLICPKGVKEIELFSPLDDSNCKSDIDQIYVNDRNTKVRNSVPKNCRPGTYLYDELNKFGEVFTVKDAKAVTFAKKEKLNYTVKSTGKVKKISSKKAKKGYEYRWDRVKTQLTSYRYKKSTQKWSSKEKTVATVYEMYGKKSAKGKYRLIGTTKANRVKSKYKYVKVKPVETWQV